MGERPIPRHYVLGLAAVIVALPAAFSLAVYRMDGPNVAHHHVHDHPVKISEMNAEPQLKERTRDARLDWAANLDKIEVPSVESNAEMFFQRELLCGTNTVFTFQSGYHPGPAQIPTVVTFNGCKTQNLSGAKKQGNACRAIGMVLGLADAPGRNDWMESADLRTVGANSADYVDDFFGPTVLPISTQPSNSLYVQRDRLEPGQTYSFTASASGHGLNSVRVLLDGFEKAAWTPATGAGCAQSCTQSATWTPQSSAISPGIHRVEVIATNQFDKTDRTAFPMRMYSSNCDRYVATYGSDSNPGDNPFQPYRTIDHLLSTPPGSPPPLGPGQTACIRTGNYTFSSGAQPWVETPGVTLRPYLAESVTLPGRLVFRREATGATIEGLRLDGSREPATAAEAGPKIYADNVTLRGNEITNDDQENCIFIGRYLSEPPPQGVTIAQNRIHDCGIREGDTDGAPDHAIYVKEARGAAITDNWIYDNAFRGVQLYPDADDSEITGNVIDGNGQGLNFSCNGDTDPSTEDTCSDRNHVEGNVIANSEGNIDENTGLVTNAWNVYGNAQKAGFFPTGNLLEDNCVFAIPGNGSFSQNGGVDPSDVGIDKFFTTKDNEPNIEPEYVNRGAGDLHLNPNACRDKYSGIMSLP